MASTIHCLFQWENCKFPRKFSWILTLVIRHGVNQCIIDLPALMNLFFFPSLYLYTHMVSDMSSKSLLPRQLFREVSICGSLNYRGVWLTKQKQVDTTGKEATVPLSVGFKLALTLGHISSVICALMCPNTWESKIHKRILRKIGI